MKTFVTVLGYLRSHMPVIISFFAGLAAVLPSHDVNNWYVVVPPLVGYVIEFFTSPSEHVGVPKPTSSA